MIAIARVEQRREVYRSLGIRSYQPYVFLLTDGRATDEGNPAVSDAFEHLKALQRGERP